MQIYLLCACANWWKNTPKHKHTPTHTDICALWSLWSAKMSASLGEAHMHFREVPLIRHEIQFKTWSASRSPALIRCQITSRRWSTAAQELCVCVHSHEQTVTSNKQTHMKCVAFWPLSVFFFFGGLYSITVLFLATCFFIFNSH